MTRPISEIIVDGKTYKCYANGMSDGDSTSTINHFIPLSYQLFARFCEHLPFSTVQGIYKDVMKPYFPE